MLRAFTLALLLLQAATLTAFAQQSVTVGKPDTTPPTRVLLVTDSVMSSPSPAELRKTHTDARSLTTISATQRTQLNDVLATISREKFASIETQGSSPANGFYYELTEFFAANGRLDWVLLQPMGVAAPKMVDDLLKRLTIFYKDRRYAIPLDKPYYNRYMTRFGRVQETRTVRTGDSTISTLAAARNTTRPDTVKYLFFNQLGLTAVPEVIYRFPNLEELDLSKNGLTQLPARLTADLPRLHRLSVLFNQIGDDSVFITKNKQLLALTLQGNNLTRIPAAVRNARNLESLWLGNNKLAELNVKALRGLKKLEDLNLYNAGLTSLPRQIRKLKRVRVMDLYYNQLTELPKQIGRMRRLQQLALAHNQLTSLPPQLVRLRHLAMLYVHHNPLAALPATFDRFRSIQLLDLGYCRFSEFPVIVTRLATLESVDLSGNNIQLLPASVTQLAGLKQLYLRSNPITRDAVKTSSYVRVIKQLEAQNTTVYD